MNFSSGTNSTDRDINSEILILESKLENNPADINIYIRLVQLYRNAGNFQQAWIYLHKADEHLEFIIKMKVSVPLDNE